MSQTTRDKLLDASLKLFAAKGFNGTTTKAVAAEAGVNEVTLFRQFGSKEKVLETLIDSRKSAILSITDTMASRLRYELVPDLSYIIRTYFQEVSKNRLLLQIIMREIALTPMFLNKAKDIPNALKHLLVDYLHQMMERGKVSLTEPLPAVETFMTASFGYMMARDRFGSLVISTEEDAFLETLVQQFAKAWTHGLKQD